MNPAIPKRNRLRGVPFSVMGSQEIEPCDRQASDPGTPTMKRLYVACAVIEQEARVLATQRSQSLAMAR